MDQSPDQHFQQRSWCRTASTFRRSHDPPRPGPHRRRPAGPGPRALDVGEDHHRQRPDHHHRRWGVRADDERPPAGPAVLGEVEEQGRPAADPDRRVRARPAGHLHDQDPAVGGRGVRVSACHAVDTGPLHPDAPHPGVGGVGAGDLDHRECAAPSEGRDLSRCAEVSRAGTRVCITADQHRSRTTLSEHRGTGHHWIGGPDRCSNGARRDAEATVGWTDTGEAPPTRGRCPCDSDKRLTAHCLLIAISVRYP